MNDTELRKDIAYCDAALVDPDWWFGEEERPLAEMIEEERQCRVELKRKQLAMWIKHYGSAE